MATWLYQLSADAWSIDKYRQTVREGKTLSWNVGRIGGQGQDGVSAGDKIVLFFCKSHTDEPGIYGWGDIMGFVDNGAKDRQVKFVVKPPSDALKMSPCWNDKVEHLIDTIRGDVKMGTMWRMTDKQVAALRREMLPSSAPDNIGLIVFALIVLLGVFLLETLAGRYFVGLMVFAVIVTLCLIWWKR